MSNQGIEFSEEVIDGKEVIVIGNRAVGKTSLLASMYMTMEKKSLDHIGNMTFIAPEDSEYTTLKDKWLEIGKQVKANQFAPTLILPYEGTKAIFTPHKFLFKTEKNSQNISFTDTKGGATNPLDPELVKRANKSFLIFCVVDAAVLMECDENENFQKNCPLEIKRILQKVLEDGDKHQPQACLFILTKCEKYMKSGNDRNALAEKFNKIFNAVLSYAEIKKFPLYYLPVQTMGCVEFSHTNPISNEMIFNVLPQKDFEPKDEVFPLAFLMLWMLRDLEKKQKRWGLITTMLAWFLGWKEDFTAYYNQLRNKLGSPLDFRSNLKGKIASMRQCYFWDI